MTLYRKDPDAISNWFNAQLEGIGHRGSSFTDVDWCAISALTHDGRSRRFLFQEFKRPNEETTTGQWWALYDLARQPNTSVWHVRQCDGLLTVEFTAFREVPKDGLLTAATISIERYREHFAAWWAHQCIDYVDPIPARIVWSEYLQRDPSLRDFVEAEIARAHIELQTAKHNAEHWKSVAMRLEEERQTQKRSRRAQN